MLAFITANYLWLIPTSLAVLEGITRLTPTKKDDGFVKRLGGAIDFVMDNVKFPNKSK